MLRSLTAPSATLQKETCIIVKQALGRLLLLLSEQNRQNAPSRIRLGKLRGHRNLRLFKA